MKTFVGLTAFVTAFPACLGYHKNSPTGPFLSGSVCPVRDSLDFLDPVERAEVTRDLRLDIAEDEFAVGPTCHITNGDEDDESLMLAGQYHKTLPHDEFGQVSKRDYDKLLDCVFSSDIDVCEDVPSGGGRRGGEMLTNPIGGAAHQVAGADSDNVFIVTPDSLLSDRLAAQQSEVYWMALTRDIPFSQYATNDLVGLAAENLNGLPDFDGLNIPRTDGVTIDPVTDLFRTDWPGVATGPMVSQFFLSDFEYDSIVVEPKAVPLKAGMDYMTAFQPWLDVQNGVSDVETEFDKENPVFIRNGRDLATLSFRDQLYTEAFRAALILFTQDVLGGSVGPYTNTDRQKGFATFGEPHILTQMASASSSTRHAWYTKWQVHRLLRPEAYGGLVHNTLVKDVITPLPVSILNNVELLDRVKELNQKMNDPGEGTFLLPMAVAEGSPTHPAYPSGHAVNNGAYITALKAFVGFEMGQRCFPDPVISNDEGTERIPYEPTGREIVGQCTDENGRQIDGLTYEGELNKVTSNVILGRSQLGVHWRMDGTEGAVMGETSSIRRLQQEIPGLPEAREAKGQKFEAIYKFRLYSGTMLELYGSNLFKLDDKFCEGLYTGDDFCNETY